MVVAPKSEMRSSDKAANAAVNQQQDRSDRPDPPDRLDPPWLVPLSIGLVVVIVVLEAIMAFVTHDHPGEPATIADIPVATLVAVRPGSAISDRKNETASGNCLLFGA